jgi:hypothetical protein
VSGGSPDLVWHLDREYAQDDPDAPRDARRAIDERGDLPPGAREDVLIVVTELLTNAIRHPPRVVGGRRLEHDRDLRLGRARVGAGRPAGVAALSLW